MRRGCLLEDYSNPALRMLTRQVIKTLSLFDKEVAVKVPFPFAFDALTLHYKYWTSIVFNPNAKTAWRTILEKYYGSDEYKQLNNAVHGNELLAKYATVNFIRSLIKSLNELSSATSTNRFKSIEDLVRAIDSQKLTPREAAASIELIVRNAINEAKETLSDIQVAVSFSHFGAPVAALLDEPDKFRQIARNRIVVHLVRFLNKLRSDAPGARFTKIPSLVSGVPLGIKRIQRWSELSRTIPTEYVDNDILAYKVASRSIRVTEQYAGIPNYVVYLDKSGSMAGGIEYCESHTICENVPKISFAAASALALAFTLRRHGAKLTLKLFDVDVHEEETDFMKIIDTLLKIKADSGTSITKVIEDAMKHRDEKIVVVTDGIDEVNEEVVKKAKATGLDITFVFIKTNNQLLQKYFPYVYLDKARPEVLLEV